MTDNEGPNLSDDDERDRWDKTFAGVLHNDNWASQIGIFCLKVVLVLNGGSLLALIGMFPTLTATKGGGSALAESGEIFLWGLLVAGVTAAFSYTYQSFALKIGINAMRELSRNQRPRPLIKPITTFLYWISVLLCIASFVLFAYGGFSILDALDQLATTAATGG